MSILKLLSSTDVNLKPPLPDFNPNITNTVIANDGQANDLFGASSKISLDGNVLVVGADGDSQTMTNSGAVYVFQKVSGLWTQKAKLKSPDLYNAGGFGYSVDINKISPIDYPEAESRIAVGAIGDDKSNLANSGTVYIWRYNGVSWVLEHTYAHNEENARSGYSVSMTEAADKIVSGVAFGNGLKTDSGVVLVFG